MKSDSKAPEIFEQPFSSPATTVDQEDSAVERITDSGKAPKLALWRRLLGLFWDSYVADPQERNYVQKVDYYLL